MMKKSEIGVMGQKAKEHPGLMAITRSKKGSYPEYQKEKKMILLTLSDFEVLASKL
jgi:hypothetical protein